MKRNVVDLREDWEFALGEQRPAAQDFQPVALPHDWCAGGQASQDAPLDAAQGWFHRKTVGWYRREIQLEKKNPQRRYWLDFGGVWECATVWVNGQEIGGQRYGYTPFRLEATGAVRSGMNHVLVRADNRGEPADRWYSGCGIYRPVRWIETDPDPLDEKKIIVTSKIQKDGSVRVLIQTGMEDAVLAVLSDPDGKCAAEGIGFGEICLQVKSPRLWSAEHPVLYFLSLSREDGDAVSLRIGIRKVEMDEEQGLRVNGQPVKLRGVCLHQDLGCIGIASVPELWRERLIRLKETGCNALRLAHHMHSAEMLDLCDEMGFYVYSECFDKWHSGLYGRYFDQDWQRDLDAMILRDRNRPCILIWGVGNEVENQGQATMVQTLGMLTARVRDLDPTRPVTYAMNPHFKKEGRKIDFSQVKDIQKLVDEMDEREVTEQEERLDCISAIAEQVDLISCNYQEQWFEDIHRRNPRKLILSTEAYPYFLGHPDSMQNYTEQVPALIPESLPYVIGSFIWTGYDYLGESMGWPSKGWTGSLFRMDGSPRISAWILKSHWTKEPMVHLSILDNGLGDELTKAHWANPPYEDVWDFPELHQGVLPYLIATNCERVEIHCGERVFYPPRPDENSNGTITGFVPWIPGKIEVMGFQNNQCVCSHELHTPGKPDRIELSVGVLPPPEPGEERIIIAKALDREKHPCIRETQAVTFRTEGDAQIVAAANCNLMDLMPFSSREQALWHGQAMAAVRRTGPGPARIIAEARGMQTGLVEWVEAE